MLLLLIVPVSCSRPEGKKEELLPTPVADPTVAIPTPSQMPEISKEVAPYPMQLGSVDIKQELIYEGSFEAGQTDMTGRGAAMVTIVDSQFHNGEHSLSVTGRTAIWNGATVDLTKLLTAGETYQIEVYVRYDNGPDSIRFDCKLEKNSSEYLIFASNNLTKGEWIPLIGSIIILM
jgi:hypothetical protein